MSKVYFDPVVGGDGMTVSDDADPNTGLQNYGHVTRFVPSLINLVAIAGWVKQRAENTDEINTEAVASTQKALEVIQQAAGSAAGSAVSAAEDANNILQLLNGLTFAPNPERMEMAFLPDGNVQQVTETLPGGAQRVTDYAYDADGRLRTATIGSPVSVRTETYNYDAEGMILSIDATEVAP